MKILRDPKGMFIKGSGKGGKLSKETKEKIRLVRKGIIFTEEHKKRLSEAHLGQHSSPSTEFKKDHTSLMTEAIKKKIGEANKISIKKLWQNSGYRKMMSEAHKGKKFSIETRKKQSEAHKGEKAFAYKGGITPLCKQIRGLLEYRLWREGIFKRDIYTCVLCGTHSGFGKAVYLHADHITPFAKILSEFLKEYDQFSPIDDKETLVRLAIKWQPFWDIDNGRTLCKSCHMKITWTMKFPDNILYRKLKKRMEEEK